MSRDVTQRARRDSNPNLLICRGNSAHSPGFFWYQIMPLSWIMSPSADATTRAVSTAITEGRVPFIRWSEIERFPLD